MIKNPKLTVSFVLSLVLGAWELISPSAELLGIGTKWLAIIAVAVTVISYLYNRVSPNKSIFARKADHVGTRPARPPRR